MRVDWEMKKLGDVCVTTQGVQIPKSKQLPKEGEGLRRYLYISDFKNENNLKYVVDIYPKKIVTENDLIVVNTGNSSGDVFRGINGVLSNNLFKVSFDKSKISTDYIYYFLKSDAFISFQDEIKRGTANPHMGHKNFSLTPIPIPPLSEQKQIVAILDKAFAAIDQAKANIEKNIQNAKELFDSKKEELFDKLGLKHSLKPITEACEKIFAGGDAPKESFSKEKTDELNVPIIANAVKRSGLYGYTNEARVTKPSITVAARGSGTGHTVFRDYPFVPIVRLIVLTPDTEKIDVEFLMYAIKNLTIMRSGSAIPQLTVPMIKGYSIPIPDIEKQNKIVESLNQLEVKLVEYKLKLNQKLIEFDDLKKSILQKAFAGELTSPNGTT